MATATFEPHVVANLELNQWSLMHVDWVIEICGNAPAYDIKIDYEAIGTLKQPELCDPFNGISLLRPTQKLTSSAGQWQDLEKHKIKVQISWKRHANTKKRQINSYIIDLSGWSEVSFLGARKPEVQIASEIKNIRDDWRPFASGSRKISVDTFTQADRDDHSQRMHEYIEEQKSKKK